MQYLVVLFFMLINFIAHANIFGIDQEGGMVVRLPRNEATNLPGNMAFFCYCVVRRFGRKSLSSRSLFDLYLFAHVI